MTLISLKPPLQSVSRANQRVTGIWRTWNPRRSETARSFATSHLLAQRRWVGLHAELHPTSFRPPEASAAQAHRLLPAPLSATIRSMEPTWRIRGSERTPPWSTVSHSQRDPACPNGSGRWQGPKWGGGTASNRRSAIETDLWRV